MAVDEVLLRRVAAGTSLPTLRLYRWAPATLSLGYGQRGGEQANLDYCLRTGIAVVRRITGGRAVLHDREVTYALVAPERFDLFPGGILGNYRVIAQVLLATIRSFGVEATLSAGSVKPAASGAERSACFTAPASYELLFEGRKMTGCAQKRQEGAFLQHGSIPLEMDLERLFRALDVRGSQDIRRALELLGGKIGWLNRWAAGPLSIPQVEEELIRQFSGIFRCEFVDEPLSQSEWRQAQELALDRYLHLDWPTRPQTQAGR